MHHLHSPPEHNMQSVYVACNLHANICRQITLDPGWWLEHFPIWRAEWLNKSWCILTQHFIPDSNGVFLVSGTLSPTRFRRQQTRKWSKTLFAPPPSSRPPTCISRLSNVGFSYRRRRPVFTRAFHESSAAASSTLANSANYWIVGGTKLRVCWKS